MDSVRRSESPTRRRITARNEDVGDGVEKYCVRGYM
jgi:hypothetical protein